MPFFFISHWIPQKEEREDLDLPVRTECLVFAPTMYNFQCINILNKACKHCIG